jgi:hypothetical protein
LSFKNGAKEQKKPRQSWSGPYQERRPFSEFFFRGRKLVVQITTYGSFLLTEVVQVKKNGISVVLTNLFLIGRKIKKESLYEANPFVIVYRQK